jgi:hypothetical protein
MSSRGAVSKGEMSRAERIRELLGKGVAPEIVAKRCGRKPSDVARAQGRYGNRYGRQGFRNRQAGARAG